VTSVEATIAILVTALAARLDSRTGKIPNGLVLFGVVSGIAMSPGSAVIGSVSCAICLRLLRPRRSVFGAGDYKLCASTGALLGAWMGILSVVVALLHLSIVPRRVRRPAAPSILLGVLVASLWRIAC
jgi:Flp pilus assembly protein protease CpaA